AFQPFALNISSLSTDLTLAVVGLAILSLMLKWLCPASARHESASFRVVTIAALLITTPTIKLSVVGFAVPALAGLLYLARRDAVARRAPGFRRVVVGVGVTCAATLVPWLARGVVLSGYPLFPLSWFCLPVDWAYPRDPLATIRDIIKAWAQARLPPF